MTNDGVIQLLVLMTLCPAAAEHADIGCCGHCCKTLRYNSF